MNAPNQPRPIEKAYYWPQVRLMRVPPSAAAWESYTSQSAAGECVTDAHRRANCTPAGEAAVTCGWQEGGAADTPGINR